MAIRTTKKYTDVMENQPKLKKEIGIFGGVSILSGIMVGSGIFFIGAHVLMRSGFSMGLALLIWLIGGLITLLYGLIYGELGAMLPEAGGYYVYLKKAYGKPLAFMSGFTNFTLLSSGSIAVLALAFSQITSNLLFNLFGFTLTNFLQILLAAFLIAGLSVLNFFGIKIGTLVQKIFMIIKIIPIFLILILGLLMGTESIDWSMAMNGVSFWTLLSMIGFAVIATFWAYEGWTNLNSVASEVKNPGKTIPFSLIITILSVTGLYFLFNMSIFRVLSLEELRVMIVETDFYFIGIPAAMDLLGTFGLYLAMITMLISVFGALNGTIMTFPRVYYAMSKDNIFVDKFKKVHPVYQTPVNAIIGSGVMAILLLIFSLQDLISMVAFGALVFNTLIFISLFIFRKKMPYENRPYKVWGYPILPAFTILITLLLVVATFAEDVRSSLIGTGFVLLGLPVYYLFDYTKRRNKKIVR
ncbi:MAG: APC family permease [Candidatus Izemoplasmatales bacterium]